MRPDRATPKSVLEMPFILSVTMGLHAAVAFFVFAGILTAPLNLFDYSINETPIDGMTWLAESGISFALVAFMSAFVAYALRARKPWGREAVMLWFVLLAAGWILWNFFTTGEVWDTIEAQLDQAIIPLFFLWYLYRKASVRAYYRALQVAIGHQPDENDKSLPQGV